MFKRIFWIPDEKRLAALWRIILQTLIFFILGLAVTGIGFFIQRPLMSSAVQPSNLIIFGTAILSNLLTLSVIMVSIWLSGRWFDRRYFVDFGVHFNKNWWIDFGFGMALGAFLMLVVFLVEWAAGWITITDVFNSANTVLQQNFLVLLIVQFLHFIGVGIQEEFLSRGYHLKNLAEGFANITGISAKWAIVIGTLLSSAIFGMLHLGNPNATLISSLNIAVAGVMLALGYLLTGELAIPIGLHITWNFFQGNVFGFPVSGTTNYSTLITIQQGGPNWITGGAFGPEAGVIGLAAMAMGCILIMLYILQRYSIVELQTALAEPILRARKSQHAVEDETTSTSEPLINDDL